MPTRHPPKKLLDLAVLKTAVHFRKLCDDAGDRIVRNANVSRGYVNVTDTAAPEVIKQLQKMFIDQVPRSIHDELIKQLQVSGSGAKSPSLTCAAVRSNPGWEHTCLSVTLTVYVDINLALTTIKIYS